MIAAKAYKVEKAWVLVNGMAFICWEQSRGNTKVRFLTISIIFVGSHVVSKEPMRERAVGGKIRSYHNYFNRFLQKYEHTGRN